LKKIILFVLFALAATAHSQMVAIVGSKTVTTDTGITFTPAAGAVSNPTTVTFSGGIAGSIYCSTQDGSTPSTNLIGTACANGSLGATTSITTAVTVKAVSGKLGEEDSAVSSAAYTISAGSITPEGTPVCGISSYGSSNSIAYTAAQTGDELFIQLWNSGMNYAFINVAYNSSAASTIIAPASGNQYSAVFEVTGITSGAHNVTWTNTTAYSEPYCFIEFSGVNSVGNVSSPTSSVSPYSVSLTITEANGYVLGQAVSGESGALTPTATSGTIAAYLASAYHSGFAQYNTSASTGSVALAGTLSTSQSMNWNLVELKY
jgi:hypothetical protein